MSEDTKNYAELTGDIVSAYVAANNIQRSELPGLIADVNSALRNIGQPTPVPMKAEPPIPIKQTIKPDYIVRSRRRAAIQVVEAAPSRKGPHP